MNADIRRVLVRAPNWIGDAVLSLPAVGALKDLYPQASITVLAKNKVTPVYLHNPAVNDIIEYDDKAAHKGIRGRVRLSAAIKERHFELAVLFQNAFDAAFIAFISGIPERAGYARDFRSKLLTRPIEMTREIKKAHQVYYYLNIVKELGGSYPERPVPRIYISADEAGWAREFLRKNGIENDVLIGASPGASYGAAKRWAPEGFIEVLARFSKDFNAVPLIFGGTDDAGACKAVSGGIGARHLLLAGEVSLREFMALLPHIRVFITNDSGPMHISAAMGVPTVAIFGSTDPALTGPLGPEVKALSNGMECSPCFDRECRFAHYNCLASIGAEGVYGAAAGFFKAGAEKWRV
ncbi:MAG: lipopolysaccharide heptosyltransferase II [Deltaproteobacteria bacterium]|nr:lipopolysaccharide heptosyltransferase II [Deltaproteobacteria bacterium]